jgi:hypothetical protein
MSASWVAGTVRAKAIARRRLGADGARAIAHEQGLAPALAALTVTPYGRAVRAGQDLARAQHAVAATLLWHLRVLAGWLPRDGARALRLLAGGFEVANLDEQLRRFGGRPADPAFELGTLETAWTRLAAAGTLQDLRHVLAASPWGDPGAATEREIHLGVRLGWADRLTTLVPEAAGWARAAVALLLVREVVLEERPLTPHTLDRATRLLGPAVAGPLSSGPGAVRLLAEVLPRDAAWVLRPVDDEAELWTAEASWWRRVEDEAFGLLRTGASGRAPVVGAVAVLAVDAWRVRAALEVAAQARGGGTAPDGPGPSAGARKLFDVLA